MNVVLIMQARVGSTRLPGKVMKEMFPGRTMLDLTLERLKACQSLSRIVVAAPSGASNDCVAAEANRCGVDVFRGSEPDVLSRYLGAALLFKGDMVVRVTSDCPLSDPDVVDRHVKHMATYWKTADFTTNMLKQSFPLGLAVEAMPIDTLERMNRWSDTPELREHVTTLAYEKPYLFQIQDVLIEPDLSSMRWTVDYPEDFDFVRAIFGALYQPGRVFRMADILAWVDQHPEVASVNAHVHA